MSQGIVLLIVMALFFGGMYAYAYFTTDYSDRQKEKTNELKWQERQKRFKGVKLAMKNGRQTIREKYAKAEERSIEIKNELKSIRSQNADPIA